MAPDGRTDGKTDGRKDGRTWTDLYTSAFGGGYKLHAVSALFCLNEYINELYRELNASWGILA